MSQESKDSSFLVAVLAAAALLVVGGLFYILRGGGRAVPPPVAPPATVVTLAPAAYREMVGEFFGGVGGLHVNSDVTDPTAKAKLIRATEIAPDEPAAWANLGLIRIRMKDLDGAARDLERARSLAPESGPIEGLLAVLDKQRDEIAGEIRHLRRAVELAPDDVRLRYSLMQAIEREAGPQGGPKADAEMLGQLGEILRRQPDNFAVLFDRARLAAKTGDARTLADDVERIGRSSADWPERTRESYAILKQSLADPRNVQTRLAFLRNVLVRSPAFQKGLDAVTRDIGTIGDPIEGFLRLPLPPPTPAAPDEGLAFTVEPIPDKGDRSDALVATLPTGEGTPVVFVASARELRRADGSGAPMPFPGGNDGPSDHGVLALDLNSDYRLDFVLAGGGGLRVYQQKDDGTYVDVTAATKLDAALLGKPAFGAWAADLEMEGDLDVVLALREGPATVLRNNGDGTFRAITPFEGATDLRDFAWADLDGDGDADAATLDAKGKVQVFSNERAGTFKPLPSPAGLDGTVALAVADLAGDGGMELLTLGPDGVVRRVVARDDGRAWDVAEAARGAAVGGKARLFAADLDNNGAIDLIASGVSGGWIALGDDSGKFRPLPAPSGFRILAIDDLNGDGTLDLAGLSSEGRPTRAMGRGIKGYHWQVIRPRRVNISGDNRINSFGVGGQMDLRAGLLVQTRVIAGPTVHFGLGDYPRGDALLVVWPNGATTLNGEFNRPADTVVVFDQKLKGSCPFLYAFDGSSMQFVTDVIWRSPLGLRINAQDTAGSAQTEDWVKIRGDQLVAKDGQYDLRVTAELWETHYWDHFALTVVDHPRGTEVLVDERFAREPPKLAVHATGPLVPVKMARDDRGDDVSETVRDLDRRYLDTFGRGQYQGVTRDHWVELEIGDEVPRDRGLYLVAQGWIHPTDSSINLALAQGGHEPPRGLALEVATERVDSAVPGDHPPPYPPPQGGRGREKPSPLEGEGRVGGRSASREGRVQAGRDDAWAVARSDLGFPAGKNKTILVNLDGVFRPGARRRLRLRTNLEVYWDRLAVAVAMPEPALKTQRLAAASAELRYRGFSRMTQADISSPELPDYNVLSGTTQRWRDLIGYYTRFGDVRELLKGVDDRYVIANAGDELALRFDAPPPPPAGWVRDFVLVGDGWNKDGDYNTAFSKTVLPLPSHSRPAYDAPAGELEDDPVYRAHPGDWAKYHTRYVTPDSFERGLHPRRAGSRTP
jgi:hypothetical protein